MDFYSFYERVVTAADSGDDNNGTNNNDDKDDHEEKLKNVVKDMIVKSYKEGLNLQTLEQKIVFYKRVENMGWEETAAACMRGILSLTKAVADKGDQKALMQSIRETLKAFEHLIVNLADQGKIVQLEIILETGVYVLENEKTAACNCL